MLAHVERALVPAVSSLFSTLVRPGILSKRGVGRSADAAGTSARATCPTARKKRQKGQAMIESALVALALVGMIIFVMDMGRILLLQQFIGERARATVRNAVVNN